MPWLCPDYDHALIMMIPLNSAKKSARPQELRSLLAEGDETGAALIIGGLKEQKFHLGWHHQLASGKLT